MMDVQIALFYVAFYLVLVQVLFPVIISITCGTLTTPNIQLLVKYGSPKGANDSFSKSTFSEAMQLIHIVHLLSKCGLLMHRFSKFTFLEEIHNSLWNDFSCLFLDDDACLCIIYIYSRIVST